MTDRPPVIKAADIARGRARTLALSRWENEGGAGAASGIADAVFRGDPEVDQLRVRVIALENLVIALLAQAPSEHLALARKMADYISPRLGYTPHEMTLRAAGEMRSLVGRAHQFRDIPQD